MDFRAPPRIAFAVVSGPCHGQTLAPKGFCISVGRTKASKMHIKDPSVSERHAEVCWTGAAWVLRDLGSSNGTKLDGVRLQPMVEARELCEGSSVMFGDDSLATVQLTPTDLSSCTVEELLQCQHEVIAQGIEAQAQADAHTMLAEWGAASAELTAGGA